MSDVLFAMELALPLRLGPAGEPDDRVVADLRELVQRHGARPSRSDKANLYRAVGRILRARLPAAPRGIWDYSDDAAEAARMFRDYSDVLQTRRGARRGPSYQAPAGAGFRSPQTPGGLFATVTFALLMPVGTPAAELVARTCAVPKPELWARATFARLLDVLPAIPFSAVRSDVFYAIPGDATWALTEGELLAPEFSYLRVIAG